MIKVIFHAMHTYLFQLYLAALILAMSFAFDITWTSVIATVSGSLIVIGGSFVGASLFAHFRHEDKNEELKLNKDTVVNLFLGTLAGIIIGGVVTKYFAMTDVEYRAGVFAASGFVSLVGLKGALTATEVNFSDWFIRVVDAFLPNRNIHQSQIPPEKKDKDTDG